MLDPTARPPLDLVAAVRLLHDHDVRWVLGGSCVIAAYGGDLVPNDLDIFPAVDEQNLTNLANALAQVDGIPWHVPEAADRPGMLTVEECRAWEPAPTTEVLDHNFVTTIGMLDIVLQDPAAFTTLELRAHRVSVLGVRTLVAPLTAVTSRIASRTRAKDTARRDAINTAFHNAARWSAPDLRRVAMVLDRHRRRGQTDRPTGELVELVHDVLAGGSTTGQPEPPA